MLSDATKKYRDAFAFGLIGVATLILLSGLSLLFKSGDDLGGAGFSERSMLFGPLFTSLTIIVPLVLAVVIVTAGEVGKNAKSVVLAALGVGAVAGLFALITWFASYGVEGEGFGVGFGGVLGAGKVVGTLLNLAAIGLIGLALLFMFSVFQGFPKPAPAQQWGQHSQQGWGRQQGGAQGWGQQGGAQGWGQQGGQQGWGQQGWGQQGGQQGGQQWGQGYAAGGWGDQTQAQAQQQGQPASAWGQQAEQPSGQAGSHAATPQGWGDAGQHAGYQGWSDTSGQSAGDQAAWGQQSEQSAGWGQQPEQSAGWAQQPEQSAGWGQQSEQSEQQWGSTASSSDQSAEGETQVWGGGTAAEQPDDAEQAAQDDDQKPPPQQGWWQQQ